VQAAIAASLLRRCWGRRGLKRFTMFLAGPARGSIGVSN